MKRFLVAIGLIFSADANAQLVVDNTTNTPAQLVQNVLLGTGVTVSNITLNGVPATSVSNLVGSFNGTASNIGLAGGVVLGSGNVQVAVGPNNSGSATLGGSGQPGTDPDLAAITPNQIYDETILEFDFIPSGDSIKFRYVFASEEYDEYVCASVNDAFGFFISGPGFSGPYTNGGENIARIPGTTTAVSINTVNLGVPGSNGNASLCAAIDPNWASYNIYYAGTNTQNSVQYDGFTIAMTAEAAVQCNQQYHIKIAIGDAGDNIFDSGVFLEGGSFSSSGVSVTATSLTGDSLMVEGCGGAIFTFYRPDTSMDFTINFNIGGTAQNGTDYTLIPDSIVVGQGTFSDSLIIYGFADGIPEGTETITISINFQNTCGSDTVEATIYLINVDPIVVGSVSTAEICPPESATLVATATGGTGPLTFTWDNGGGFGSTVVVEPLVTTSYTVTATDSCGNTASFGPVEVIVACDIIVPNVFSPNNDGFNDEFFIINLDQYPGSHLTIYNRWGTIVYENSDYKNDWKGGDVPDGVYYYIVETQDLDIEPKHGHVTIFRNKK